MGRSVIQPKDRIIVALDVGSLEKATEHVGQLKSYVSGFKVGLELITAVGGPQAIEAISEAGGDVFYDAKFKDIPNTVGGAVRGVTRRGVKMFNVHCLGGKEMMAKARETAEKQAKELGIPRPLVLGVTILTSLDYSSLVQMGLARELTEIPEGEDRIKMGKFELSLVVAKLAELAQEAGLDGVIASAQEAQAIRLRCGKDFLIVTPAIRPLWAAVGDQKRPTTPTDALKADIDYMVIGRPLTDPPPEIGGPVEAVKKVIEEIEAVN